MSKAFFILLIFSATLLSSVKNDKNNIISIRSVYCIANDRIFQNFSCSMKSVKRGRKLIYGDVFVAEPIKNIWGTLELFQKNSVWYLPYIVNSSDHLCNYLVGRGNHFYTKFAMDWLLKYCKLSPSCPISGLQVCKDMVFTLDEVPLIIPPGDYRMEVKLYKDKNDKLLATIKAHSSITLKPLTPIHLH